jgi:acetolactate synthase I/II/III large subunit
MPKMTGGDIVVRALEDEEIGFAFGIPGTHNIELYDSLSRSASVRPILVTDEQSASFMADGVARSSGKLACINLVPGAGMTHALSGIAEAHLDGVPMLVLACGIRRDTGKSFQLHEVDQLAIARPVTKAQFRVDQGAKIYSTIRSACQVARTAPAGPVMVEVPAEHYFFRHHAEFAPPFEPQPLGSLPFGADEIELACKLIESVRRPLLYLGAGAASAGTGLIAMAERLNAPVATTISGKGVFDETHPLWLWCGFGTAAPPFARKIAASCDLTLAIGCRFSEVGTGSYGVKPPGKLLHVDVDPSVFSKNYPAEICLAADAADFVAAVLPKLESRPLDASLRNEIRSGHAQVQGEWKSPEDSTGVYPPQLLSTVQRLVSADTVYATDSGNGTFLAMECLRLPHQRSFLAPVDYSCMGYAVPAAIGAALASPERQVVALTGDGAFLMTGLELITARQLKLPVLTLVLRDHELAQIAQFQQIALGRKSCSELPDYDLAGICRGIGAAYFSLARNREIEPVLTEALSRTQSGGPVVVEVAIDYSQKTYFTRGVVRTNFGRLPWRDRIRMVWRALERKLT